MSACWGFHHRCRARRLGGPRLAIPTSSAPTASAASPTASTLVRDLDGALRLRWLLDGDVAGAGAGHVHFELAILQSFGSDETLRRSFLAELRELAYAQVLLVERRIDLLHDLLQAIGSHDVIVLLHAGDRFFDQLPRIVFARRL